MEVLPELYITLNGERVEKKYVNSGENLNVTCHAVGARPTTLLSFNDRNENVTELPPPTTSTSTSRISFLLIKRLEEETITCKSTQGREGESDLTKYVTVTVTVYGKRNPTHTLPHPPPKKITTLGRDKYHS